MNIRNSSKHLLTLNLFPKESTTADRLKFNTIYQVPFNSKNKYAITIHRPSDIDDENVLGTSELIFFCKGAPEVLLEKCSSYLCPDGSEKPLDSDSKKQLEAIQDSWSRRGQRVLLLAKKIIPSFMFPGGSSNDVEMTSLALSFNKDLCIIGLVGIIGKNFFPYTNLDASLIFKILRLIIAKY
jgi:sodium/potassium-transporting ATPase subunit alpha